MTMLTKIGNSKGLRIPKVLIEKAHLENVQIELEVVENGLLLKPMLKREKWKENIKNILLENNNNKDKGIINDFLNDSDLEDFKW